MIHKDDTAPRRLTRTRGVNPAEEEEVRTFLLHFLDLLAALIVEQLQQDSGAMKSSPENFEDSP
jgi:hypothetical protein